MSKIYKALEKAEREREKELKRKSLSISADVERGSGESKKTMPDLPKVAGIFSDKKLVSFFQPSSLAAEQFRKLRTHLLRFKIADSPRTILVMTYQW